MQGWIAQIAQAPAELLVFAVVIAGMGFYNGFVGLRRARLIEDAPTAKVRSAHQGYVELIGTAATLPGEPIISRLTQIPCCWHRYRIEEHHGKSWRTIDSGQSDDLFLLRDDTGECVIDPEGAHVDSTHGKSWFGSSLAESFPGGYARDAQAHNPSLGGMLAQRISRNLSFGMGQYRFSESVLLEGDPLYAIGWFKSHDDSDREKDHAATTAQILRDWKRDPKTLAERFDHNKDGTVDTQEWEHARRAAAAEAGKEIIHQAQHTHVNILSKPKGRPYLLANQAQCALVRGYHWRMRLGFLGFFVGGAVASVMLGARFLS